ncbi:hypothetical protein [Variovorax sp. OV329]|uniref:hypothetical protein n=1 Tax=Variovorax sp. OV329 TaxID=1882825 RepID=UPI000B876973|nr:hypothetical protein [Variovorax sp. OV329]
MNEDPNLSVVSLVAHALGNLREEFMLVGGCAVGLLITDTGRPSVRQTADVDMVTEVTSFVDYYKALEPLKKTGFSEDHTAEHMCRWRKGELILDVMPSQEVLGHSVNRWYAEAVKAPQKVVLPSGDAIHIITAPFFVATKLESFNSRGEQDYLHHDMEDILNIVDGREELLTELASAPEAVRMFVQEEIDGYLADETFVDRLEWMFPDGRAELVIKRLRTLAGV